MINYEKVYECANECLSCKTKPCTKGCPLENNITDFIKCIKEKKYKAAYKILDETTVFPAICGRICPHEKQCQGKCIKGIKSEPIQIGYLESIIGDMAIENEWKISQTDVKLNKHVLVIGGGPAGLTCAAFLKRNGINVTIYEKYNYLGGILKHGIPSFRLDKTILEKSIQRILNLGIDVKYNMELGKNFTLEDVKDKYDAIFISIGANISTKMDIPGEKLDGVYGGNELLEYNVHPDYRGKTVVVSGGGNVAMDVSRTVKRMGAKKVYVVYRRSEKEMPAETKEIKEAKDEGIEFLFQNNIVQILGNKKVEKIECIKTKLVQKERDTRLSPVNIEGSNYYLDCDYVIMAIGSKADERIIDNLDIIVNEKKRIKIDNKGTTSDSKIYAGGDVAGNKATVAYASRAGRDAAYAIIQNII